MPPMNTKIAQELAEQAKAVREALAGQKYDIAKSLSMALEKRAHAHRVVEDTPEETEVRNFEDIHLGHHAEGSENRAFQKSADDLYVLGAAMRFIKHDDNDDPDSVTVNPRIFQTNAYRKFRREHGKLIEQGSRFAKSRFAKANSLASTAVGLGDEWVPTQHSPTLLDAVRTEARIASLFRLIRMPSNPYTLPVRGTLPKMKLLSEATDDAPSQITKSNPATANKTLTAKKGGFAVALSEELQEDSIIPIIPWLRDEMIQAMAHGLDSAIVNGDTTEPHQDSDVDAATHFDKAWKGLRKATLAANQVNGGTLALSSFRNARAGMARYAGNPDTFAWLASHAGHMRLAGLAQVETAEKYMNNATVLRGELARLDRSPVIVSDDVRQDLNASGVYDGTTKTKSSIIGVNRTAWVLGERRGVTIKAFKDPRTDQDQLIVTARWIFSPIYDETADGLVSFIYNVANTA